MNYSDTEDHVLTELLKSGSAEAFQAIYIRYWKPLFQLARRKMQSEAAAAEIVQDLFVDIWERREKLVVENLDRYLFTAVKYRIINQVRKNMLRKEYWDESIADMLSYFDERAENNLALEDLNNALENALSGLPAKTRDIFKMNRLENLSVREISDSLAIPERTVEYHITQSLRRVRVHLKHYATSLMVLLSFVG